jgi:hypothetical protein
MNDMKNWIKEGYTVYEEAFDYNLHCFRVVIDNKEDQYIYPQTIEDMDSMIEALDLGEDVNSWEDGYGNIINT